VSPAPLGRIDVHHHIVPADESLGANAERKRGIGRDHALALFPRYRKAEEAVDEARRFGSRSAAARSAS
jgi:hypothetical protein